jgi:hypothetical protein
MGKCRLAEDCAPSGIRKLLGFRLAKSVLDAMDSTNPFEQIGPWTPARRDTGLCNAGSNPLDRVFLNLTPASESCLYPWSSFAEFCYAAPACAESILPFQRQRRAGESSLLCSAPFDGRRWDAGLAAGWWSLRLCVSAASMNVAGGLCLGQNS